MNIFCNHQHVLFYFHFVPSFVSVAVISRCSIRILSVIIKYVIGPTHNIMQIGCSDVHSFHKRWLFLFSLVSNVCNVPKFTEMLNINY